MISTALSFLRLIYCLFIMRRKCQLDYMKVHELYGTIKLGTPEHGTMKHGTPAGQQNNTPDQWRKNGIHQNTSRTPWNNNGTPT